MQLILLLFFFVMSAAVSDVSIALPIADKMWVNFDLKTF